MFSSEQLKNNLFADWESRETGKKNDTEEDETALLFDLVKPQGVRSVSFYCVAIFSEKRGWADKSLIVFSNYY